MDGELCYTACCYCHGIPVVGGESFSFPFQRKEPGPKRSCAVSVTELGLEPRPLHPGKVVVEESVASVWGRTGQDGVLSFPGKFSCSSLCRLPLPAPGFCTNSQEGLGTGAQDLKGEG